jgi:hypothetical protein
MRTGQMTLLASECHDCGVDLDYWGRNRITTTVSLRVIEVCDECAKDRAAGLQGEIQVDDGTIYGYLYLPHSQVTSFYLDESEDDSAEYDPDAEEFSGSYSPEFGPFYVTGTTPYPHLEELCEKWLKLCPDARERARDTRRQA